jgi:hypothetical protein
MQIILNVLRQIFTRQANPFNLGRRARRGASLLDATLGLIVIIAVASQFVRLVERQALSRAALLDARHLTDLAQAGRSLVIGQSQTFVTGAVTSLTVQDLAVAGVLTAGRTSQSATGRDYIVSISRRSANEVVIMARAMVQSGEPVTYNWPQGGEGIGLVGLVHSQSPEFIRGSSLNYSLEWMTGGFAAAKPGLGEMVALDVIRADQSIEPYLHRVEVPLNPQLNTMETSLDMGGNNIENVGNLTAQSITVSNDLTTMALVGTTNFVGDVTTGTLNVTGTGTFQADITVGGRLDAASATISAGVTAGTLTTPVATVNGVITAQDAVISGTLTTTDLGTTSLVTTTLTATDAVTAHLSADLVTSLAVTSATQGEFETITTGSCTGC